MTAMEEKPAHGSASTAPTDRRHRRTMRTRAAIEKAALRLFAEQGFANTTVEQIAEAADIAPRTFFRHFPSKEAVLYGDSEEAMAQFRQRLAARPADEHPVRSLTAAMLESADQLEEQREQFLQRAELLNSLSSTGNYELHLMRQRWVCDLTELLSERAGASSNHTCPAAWATALLGCFGADMHAWLTSAEGTPLRRVFADVLTGLTGALEEANELLAERTGDVSGP